MQLMDYRVTDGATPHHAIWHETANRLVPLQAISTDETTDVAIVGAGYAGLNAALRLSELGLRAVVLEAGEPGSGASGRNGGQVIPGLKHDPEDLLRIFGDARGRRLIDFAGNAPTRTFGVIERYGLQCDVQKGGWLQPAVSEATTLKIDRRAKQWMNAAGVEAHLLDAQAIQKFTGTTFYKAGWIDPRGGQLQPLSYARELARAALEAGATIYSRSPATRLSATAGGWTMEANGHCVRARKVLLCTNAYSGRLLPGLKRSIIPASSILCATEPLPADLRKTIMPCGLPISDARRLLNYLRFDPAGRFLIGGRGSFGLHEPEGDFQRLRQQAEAIFPQLRGVRWEASWGGRFALTTDHLPHLGNPADGLYYAVGCNGRGVALLSQLGRAIADLAAGLPHEEAPLPVRKLSAIPFHRFRRPGLEAVALWYRTLDRLER